MAVTLASARDKICCCMMNLMHSTLERKREEVPTSTMRTAETRRKYVGFDL
ncbi:hypothetical protein BJ165DRAFT_1503814, partial [Panaeolus papilionaceus]